MELIKTLVLADSGDLVVVENSMGDLVVIKASQQAVRLVAVGVQLLY